MFVALGSGQISREELKMALSSQMSDPNADIDSLLDSIDLDDDGQISYEEFKQMMIRRTQ